MAEQREEERERVEDDVRFAVLCEGLDLGCLNRDAAEPDDAFDGDGGGEGGDGDGGERGGGVRAGAREELGDAFLEDLEEGDDHYDGEDEDAEGFEAAAANREFVLEGADAVGNELVGCVYYEGAEEVEGGVDERGD